MSEPSPIRSRVEGDPADHVDEAIVLFHAYWLSKANGRFAPAWSEIDLSELPPDLLPYVIVCDVLPDNDYRFRYWGRGHADYYGEEYSGRLLSDLKPDWAQEHLRVQYDRVVETGRALAYTIEYQELAQPVYSYRAPLSDDGETVTGIFSVVDRKTVRDSMRAWYFAGATDRS